MNMEIRKRLVHFLGGYTHDEVDHTFKVATRCGQFSAYMKILEKFERHDEVPADELRDYIKLFIQLKLRELRNRK